MPRDYQQAVQHVAAVALGQYVVQAYRLFFGREALDAVAVYTRGVVLRDGHQIVRGVPRGMRGLAPDILAPAGGSCV